MRVEVKSVTDFKTNVDSSNSRIIDILEEMKELNYKYSGVMESRAANKFKEVMDEKLKDEIKNIESDRAYLNDKLSGIIKLYDDTKNEIGQSVGDSNG